MLSKGCHVITQLMPNEAKSTDMSGGGKYEQFKEEFCFAKRGERGRERLIS